MVLSDLSLSQNATSDTIKAELESKLRAFLPEGSFTIVLRSYQGDFRARSNSQASYKAMILLDAAGRKAALEKKNEMESIGFRVSSTGDVSLN